MTSYPYIGPDHILERVYENFQGFRIGIPMDFLIWIHQTKQKLQNGILTVTYVINEEKQLLIADRHSEHVQCAFGQPVLAAGELTIEVDKQHVEIFEISNQSTGYCPHVNSWSVVEEVLSKMGMVYPDYFTSAFTFGYCDTCQKPSILKGFDDNCSRCGLLIRKL